MKTKGIGINTSEILFDDMDTLFEGDIDFNQKIIEVTARQIGGYVN